jgi:monoamine oxidase
MRTTDVLVLGAGAAGLAAGSTLTQHGIETITLEARERIGGRVCTRRDARVAIPIELGAEFLHGDADETMALVRAARLVTIDVPDVRHEHRGHRRFRAGDFWQRLDGVMRYLHEDGPDRSFAQFLAAGPGGRRAARDRRLAREFVEGFHAADVLRISEHALARGGSPAEEPAMGRVLDGYDTVIEALAAPHRQRVLTGCVARHLWWRRGHVEVDSSRGRFRARAAVVTLPIGVMQARPGDEGTLAIEPAVPRWRSALGGLASGAVTRIVVRIDETFFDEHLAGVGFLQGDDPDFPVLWTQAPVRAPIVVAWSGGVRAAALSAASTAELKARVVAAIARHLDLRPGLVAAAVRATWTHDWQSDPFSRGAYSFALVGGADAGEALAQPVDGTLYYAGEASAAEGASGTVHGAIGAGRRAGEAIARRLRTVAQSAFG